MNEDSSFQLGEDGKCEDGICVECRQLFTAIAKEDYRAWQKLRSSPFRDHYKSAREIQDSSRRGCNVCTLLIEVYGVDEFEEDSVVMLKETTNNPNLPRAPRVIFDDYIQGEGYSLGLNLLREPNFFQKIKVFPSEAGGRCTCRETYYDLQVLDPDPPINEIIRPSTGKYLSRAKQWLIDCSSTHEHCSNVARHFLPTRLLRLDEEGIRLILTAQIPDPQVVRYATLSHAWGSLEFFRLQKGNVEYLQRLLPENKLTKTFRDAIYITRSLGLEYLWIDSLCIVQDDEEDWVRESGLMSSVYGGSTINIAAADSIDGNGGCLYDESETRANKAFGYRLRLLNNEDKRLWELAPSFLYKYCTRWTHLAERAWALQERILAPRTLQFSKTDMLWECNEKDACSLFPKGLPQNPTDEINRVKTLHTATWPEIVSLYSRAKLTKSNDKLVALSGLAHSVQSKTRDEYLAGMWRKNLEDQLLWSVNRQPGPRPSGPYRAPTVSAEHDLLILAE